MVSCTNAIASSYPGAPGTRPNSAAAAANAAMTLPSSATVVPAMSRQATVISGIALSDGVFDDWVFYDWVFYDWVFCDWVFYDSHVANVSSATAGEHVIPRPPGPVTSMTPGATCER